ncbi:MAG: GNAT family N-acetyltransferase [Candidatus Obscuribacterales bacterium]|nr:GNAT family N-acetyltransferase [Candidatus Obscuribacterales bacterium]
MSLSQSNLKPQISLRAATLADVDVLLEIVHSAYRGGVATVSWKNENHIVQGPRIKKPQMEQIIQSSDASIRVAELDNGELGGCALVDKHGEGVVHIGMIAVDPGKQNLGLGKSLIQDAEDYARERFKATTAKMYVLNGRPELMAWYNRLGYAETGHTEPFPSSEGGSQALNDDAHLIEISKAIAAV